MISKKTKVSLDLQLTVILIHRIPVDIYIYWMIDLAATPVELSQLLIIQGCISLYHRWWIYSRETALGAGIKCCNKFRTWSMSSIGSYQLSRGLSKATPTWILHGHPKPKKWDKKTSISFQFLVFGWGKELLNGEAEPRILETNNVGQVWPEENLRQPSGGCMGEK